MSIDGLATTRQERDLGEIDYWTVLAAQAAADKTGTDTVILRVGEVLVITDAFVITSGANTRQVLTIVEAVEERVKEGGGPAPRRIEGLDDATWVLLDYGSFVVHVFLEETRRYYDLERLWADVPRTEWEHTTLCPAAST